MIAEDLGDITAEVREAMQMYGIPGIKVLLLAFETGARESVYLPHNYPQNCVVYTGTHDVNTIMGCGSNRKSIRKTGSVFSITWDGASRPASTGS